MHIFLCGERGIGKTTIIGKAVETLARTTPLALGGFITRFGDGEDRSLYMGPAAERFPLDDRHRIARPVGDGMETVPGAFDGLGVEILKNSLRTANLIVMDELGFLENEELQFQDMVMECVLGNIPIVGSVKQQNVPWYARFIRHAKVEILPVNPHNREILVPLVTESLRRRMPARAF